MKTAPVFWVERRRKQRPERECAYTRLHAWKEGEVPGAKGPEKATHSKRKTPGAQKLSTILSKEQEHHCMLLLSIAFHLSVFPTFINKILQFEITSWRNTLLTIEM